MSEPNVADLAGKGIERVEAHQRQYGGIDSMTLVLDDGTEWTFSTDAPGLEDPPSIDILVLDSAEDS